MIAQVYKQIDLSHKRHIYGCGDIHGCFDTLEEKLKEVNFDPDKDVLITTGDLVDRGPKSFLAAEYARKPWFYRVIGNHELMVRDHVLHGDSYMHTNNGGGWLSELPLEEQNSQYETLLSAPYLLEIKTPKGLKVGFVHADLRWNTWQENIRNPDLNVFVWSREGILSLSDCNYDPSIKGINKVFFGHNAVREPISRGNCNWIDTGCGFSDGKLTIVDVETFGNTLLG